MNPFLVDGPLMAPAARRKLMIERMARDLVEADAMCNRDDAISVLRAKDYPRFDIFAFVDEVIAVAFQKIVAKEMSDG